MQFPGSEHPLEGDHAKPKLFELELDLSQSSGEVGPRGSRHRIGIRPGAHKLAVLPVLAGEFLRR